MPQLFTYLVVTYFGPLTWSLWNFRHNSWKKYRTLHLKKSLEEYEPQQIAIYFALNGPGDKN